MSAKAEIKEAQKEIAMLEEQEDQARQRINEIRENCQHVWNTAGENIGEKLQCDGNCLDVLLIGNRAARRQMGDDHEFTVTCQKCDDQKTLSVYEHCPRCCTALPPELFLGYVNLLGAKIKSLSGSALSAQIDSAQQCKGCGIIIIQGEYYFPDYGK